MARTFCLVALLFGMTVLILVSSSIFVAAASKNTKSKSANKKKVVKKYNEIQELMSDMGRDLCTGLAKLIKGRKKFNGHRRCDLYAECIEDLSGMTDAMVKELDMTQQDIVDTAMRFPHYATLQMNLKKVAKTILQKKQPSEKQISEELSKEMSQWILNVATGQDGSGGGMQNLGRDQLKGLRNMGIKLPSQGALDDDELDEENYLLDEGDKAWGQSRSHEQDVDEEDDDEDEDL